MGLVVQLVRISACHAEGRGFESRPDRQKPFSYILAKRFFGFRYSLECIPKKLK